MNFEWTVVDGKQHASDRLEQLEKYGSVLAAWGFECECESNIPALSGIKELLDAILQLNAKYLWHIAWYVEEYELAMVDPVRQALESDPQNRVETLRIFSKHGQTELETMPQLSAFG